jgi:hypothetical protein
MLGGRCCLASFRFLHNARAAQSGAGVSRLVFRASIVFPCPEDRFGFTKSNTHPRAYRVQLLTFECQNVCQKGFNATIHRICPDVVPELSGDLTVGRATADYHAMGFNKRKMEDRRRKAAEKEATARRALGPQIIEDSVKLIESWNARQAAHMPMLFSPTIEAASTAGYWFLRARCPACRTTGDVDLRRLDWHRGAAVTALIPALSCRSCRPNAPFAELICLSRSSVAEEYYAECSGNRWVSE